ncbi:MAG: GlsB/YeaQ/YmgE family stress response membrane protein [Proteobacteria bacterium]|nr:GlsB/YeaQ/YmgE family stress response membrane protein [Pseudomonadota bacterium]
MDLLTWIIVGLVAGLLASAVVGSGFGVLGDIVVGICGAFVGGWVFQQLGWRAPFAGLAGTIAVAFVGAALLLGLLRLIRMSSRGRRVAP